MDKTIKKAIGNNQEVARTIADGLTFTVNVVPLNKEGPFVSASQLEQLRKGSQPGSLSASSYGTTAPKKTKAKKRGAKSNV
ncbi:hypothetical protein [Hyphomicrobium sp. ghe19]|uniref:hypothetical protein n=1 Tax=Hyphomicrobium sp. ghe19 TaxID=2682968 RepID=UPI0013669D50|nr:hypothetical protein HYPP_04383 [Hyphomicrobium sp. ghe19]